MIKKFMKKASMCILAFMLSLSLIPLKTIHAASIKAADLKTDDVINAGDVFGNLEFLGSFSYSDEDGISLGTDSLNSNLPYIVKSEVGGKTYNRWKVTSVNKSGAAYTISVMGVLTPTATANDLTVTGKKGVKITDQNLSIDFTNLSITAPVGSDVTSWFANMPTGLTAKVISVDNDSVKIQISGTPTAISSEAMQIKIPDSAFGGSEDLTVTANANAKFDISERKATIENIEIKGVIGIAVDKDITITLTNDELAFGNMDISKKPITNLPDGIKLGYGSSTNSQKFKISVYGKPTTIGNGTLELTIPGEWLKSGEDLKVTANSNAKFDIQQIAITEGTGGTYILGEDKGLTFTCNANANALTAVWVNNILVDPENYTVESGSTILTLKASYLDSLHGKEHTLKLQYGADLFIGTTFTIKEKEATNSNQTSSPKTGDSTSISLPLSLLVLSGGVIVLLSKKRKIAIKNR